MVINNLKDLHADVYIFLLVYFKVDTIKCYTFYNFKLNYILLLTEIVSFFFSKTTCFCPRKDCAFCYKKRSMN